MDQRKVSFSYFLYNLGLGLSLVFFLPYFLIRNLVKRRPIFAYFRKLSSDRLRQIAGRPVIWVQAVSVGEVIVANIVIKELRRLLPQHAIVLTTTTPTGQAMALKLLGEEALVSYFPFDLPGLVKRFIAQINPCLFVMMEAEIWPNVIRYCRKTGVKVALVNGLISDRAFKSYSRFTVFMKTVLAQVDLLAMQTAEGATRVGRLGAPEERIRMVGNAKFDQAYPEFGLEVKQEFLQQYQWEEADPILVAASTHKGEEPIVITAFQTLLAETPSFKLILAPRHPERGEEVAVLLKEAGLSFKRRSTGQGAATPQVVLLDTFGELGLAFNVADLVFMGGSLTPVGGHNVLEAAAQFKPVIYGPYMYKTRESQRLLEEVDAGFTVHDAVELAATVRRLRSDSVLYEKRGRAAYQAVLRNKGSAAQMAALVAALLKEAHS
jgi:3-deoxy-D-manno-octulosonic-acid transferase